MSKEHFASSFDSFLEAEGTLEETTEVAIKFVEDQVDTREPQSGGARDADMPLAMSPAEFRRLGYRLVDRIADYLGSLPELPAAPRVKPREVRGRIGQGPLPAEGVPAEALLDEAAELLIDWSRHNGHPRSWGYIIGSPAPIGMLGDFLASAVNPNLAAWTSSPAASEIEVQVVRWIAELLGYPTDCGGLLVSGGNMANFVGVLAARRARAGWDLRAEGLGGPRPALRLYASEETHTWVQKAADLFGLGTAAIRWIPTDSRLRLRIPELERRIAEDKAAGDRPFLVIGTAGTVSTGAVDPLPELAALARAEDLWFHVDGAYGALAVGLPEAPPALEGLRLADSLAVDAHKWLYAPLEAGCVLVRDREALRGTFSYRPTYYHHPADPDDEMVNFYEWGPQNSRGFRALKVWLILRRAGRDAFRAQVAADIRLAGELHRCLAAAPEIEAATQGLSITTFRYRPEGLDADAPGAEAYLNELNAALLTAVQQSGEAFLSNALVEDRFLLRACITNFRSRPEDVRALAAIVQRLGRAIRCQMSDIR